MLVSGPKISQVIGEFHINSAMKLGNRSHVSQDFSQVPLVGCPNPSRMGLELRQYGVEQQNPQHFEAWLKPRLSRSSVSLPASWKDPKNSRRIPLVNGRLRRQLFTSPLQMAKYGKIWQNMAIQYMATLSCQRYVFFSEGSNLSLAILGCW